MGGKLACVVADQPQTRRVCERRESASEAACILSPNDEYLSTVLLRIYPTTNSVLCASHRHSEGAIRGPALPQRNEVHHPASQGLQVGTWPTGATAVEEGMLSSVHKARAVSRVPRSQPRRPQPGQSLRWSIGATDGTESSEFHGISANLRDERFAIQPKVGQAVGFHDAGLREILSQICPNGPN